MKLPLILFVILCTSVVAETKAVLTTDTQPNESTTLVWSPLFQASWDKLNPSFNGKLVKVEPENKVMETLDQFKWEEKMVMPEGGYAVFLGPSTREFITEVKKEVFEKFNYKMSIDDSAGHPNGKTVLGVLVRDLTFKKKFFRSKIHALDFNFSNGKSHPVHFFGTAKKLSSRYGKNVKILSHDSEKDSFILSIQTDKPAEQLMIYKPSKAISFDSAIKHVNAAIKKPLAGELGSATDGYLHEKDVVKIPYVSVDSAEDFTTQLKGLRYYQGEPEPRLISKALQITKFELFEKGARVRVETRIDDVFGGPPPQPNYIPRDFICDQPFFIFTWKEKATLPYFAIWVDSANVLQPFKK